MHPDVFHAEKKPIWQATLGALGLAALMVAGTFLGLDPAIGFMLIIFFFVLLIGGVLLLPYAYNPMELRVDEEGMEVRARGQTTRILWSQLEEVRIVPAPGNSKGDWLMAWPMQAPMQLPYRMYHPEWKPEHAAVKVCELSTFKGDTEAIKAAVQRSAGARWNDSAAMR